MKLNKCFIWLIFFLCFNNATAKLHFSLSQTATYDQNIYRNFEEEPDWLYLTILNSMADFSLNQFDFRLNYEGGLGQFQTHPERLFQVHQTGIDITRSFSSTLHFNGGTELEWRINKAEYNLYNYFNWPVYTQLRWTHWQMTPLETGWQFRIRNFDNLTEFSYRENFGFLRMKHFFESRTTFIGEVDFFQKSYLNNWTAEEVVVSEKEFNGRGQGRGWGRIKHASDTTFVTHNLTVLSISQWRFKIRLAQSLTEKTGLSLDLNWRQTPQEQNRFFLGPQYLNSADDELYDDPYAYGGYEIRSGLTRIFGSQIRLKVNAAYLQKKYSYDVSRVLSEESFASKEKRADQQSMFGVQLLIPWKLNAFVRQMNFILAADYLVNHSNDFYFDYQATLVTGGLELTL